MQQKAALPKWALNKQNQPWTTRSVRFFTPNSKKTGDHLGGDSKAWEIPGESGTAMWTSHLGEWILGWDTSELNRKSERSHGLSPWARTMLGKWGPRKAEKQEKAAVAGSKTVTHCQLQSQENIGSMSPHHPFNMEQPDSRHDPQCQDVNRSSFRLWN